MTKGKLRHLRRSPTKKSRKFYEETFGLERVSHSRCHATLRWGDESYAAAIPESGRCRRRRGKDFVSLITSGYGWMTSKR